MSNLSFWDLPPDPDRWIVYSLSAVHGQIMYWTGNSWSPCASSAERMSEGAALACSLARSMEQHRPYAAFCEAGKERKV